MFSRCAPIGSLSLAALLLVACATNSPKKEENCEAVKPGTITSVNSYCAVMPEDPVDPEVTREWNGQKVGFCCDGCIAVWNKKTDFEKDAAVKAAVAKGKVSG